MDFCAVFLLVDTHFTKQALTINTLTNWRVTEVVKALFHELGLYYDMLLQGMFHLFQTLRTEISSRVSTMLSTLLLVCWTNRQSKCLTNMSLSFGLWDQPKLLQSALFVNSIRVCEGTDAGGALHTSLLSCIWNVWDVWKNANITQSVQLTRPLSLSILELFIIVVIDAHAVSINGDSC